jgi:hypothetical protein
LSLGLFTLRIEAKFGSVNSTSVTKGVMAQHRLLRGLALKEPKRLGHSYWAHRKNWNANSGSLQIESRSSPEFPRVKS